MMTTVPPPRGKGEPPPPEQIIGNLEKGEMSHLTPEFPGAEGLGVFRGAEILVDKSKQLLAKCFFQTTLPSSLTHQISPKPGPSHQLGSPTR
jgi:hypothetical protein